MEDLVHLEGEKHHHKKHHHKHHKKHHHNKKYENAHVAPPSQSSLVAAKAPEHTT
jgi:hypothetical protein